MTSLTSAHLSSELEAFKSLLRDELQQVKREIITRMEGALGASERMPGSMSLDTLGRSSTDFATHSADGGDNPPERLPKRRSRSSETRRSSVRKNPRSSESFQDFLEHFDNKRPLRPSRKSRSSSIGLLHKEVNHATSPMRSSVSSPTRPSVLRSADDETGEMQVQMLVPSTNSRSLEMSPSNNFLHECESDDGDHKGAWGVGAALQAFVLSQVYNNLSASLLVANAVWIGVQTDYFARYWTLQGLHDRLIEFLFCVSFTLDVSLRICAFRSDFFSWLWNVVDFVLVIMQIFENIAVQVHLLHVAHFANVLRLVRLWRPIRNWRIFAHLRTQLHTIVITTKDLLWMLALTVTMNYAFAVVDTMFVTDYKVQTGRERLEEEGAAELEDYFGTLDRSMTVVFMAISEGIHWRELSDPLAEYCSPWLQILFAAYMSFILFAVMNVITANFIESAQEVSKDIERTHVMEHIHKLFQPERPGEQPIINREKFEAALGHEDMDPFLSMIGLAPERAQEANLFALIDEDNSGTVDISELVHGCMQLTGQARALDLARLCYDVANERLASREHRKIVEQALGVRGRSRSKKFENRTSIIMSAEAHDCEGSALFHGNEEEDD